MDIFEIEQLKPYRIEFFEMRLMESESLTQKVNVLLKMLKKFKLKAVSDLLLQEEDFIRGQQIEQLQEQSANEEFKSYLAEILEIFLKGNSIRILENLLVSLREAIYPIRLSP